VSVTTVSHALNGKGRIEPDTIKRIQAAAERLGYQASHAARNLRGGRTGRIAVINSQSSPFRVSLVDLYHFVRLLAGASEHAVAQGYTPVLTLGSPEEGDAGFPVDGVILVDPVTDEPLLGALHQAGVPVVTTGRDPNGHETAENWVDNDLQAATRQILDHLVAQGARRVGIVASSPLFSYSQDALIAYREWAEERGQPSMISEVEGALSETGGYIAAQALLDRADPPDAIHCVTDRYAIGALLAADSRGLVVPDDLLISAGTDSDAARTNSPSLTALDLNPEMIGRQASEMLIALIEGKQLREQRIVPFELIVRDSTER
jgi:DNA-binding LacI/PurR family transcriptional regulator